MKLKGKKIEECSVIINPNGKQVDFIDNRYYPDAISGAPDSTRIVLVKPYTENGYQIASDGNRYSGLPEQTNKGIQPLYHIKVAWFNQLDAMILDDDGIDVGRRGAFTEVIAGIDISKINKKDMAYCETFFKGLLDESRVRQYMATGLLVDPKDPEEVYSKKVKCGNYIGHVAPSKYGEYNKHFNGNVGARVHESSEMVEKRRKHYELKLSRINEADKRDEEAILKLQKDIASRDAERQRYISALEAMNKKNDIER